MIVRRVGAQQNASHAAAIYANALGSMAKLAPETRHPIQVLCLRDNPRFRCRVHTLLGHRQRENDPPRRRAQHYGSATLGNVNWPYPKLPLGCTVIQSFDNDGKRTLSIYSDPHDPQRETSTLRLDDDGVLRFKITTNISLDEKTYEHLRECPSANLKDCIQHIGQGF
jgi:hypothetical protein